jgi:hypothetical protein
MRDRSPACSRAIAIARVFPRHVGRAIDSFARAPLWAAGSTSSTAQARRRRLSVGARGPARISKLGSAALKAILSNEPGY